jgi:hypothetical protein
VHVKANRKPESRQEDVDRQRGDYCTPTEVLNWCRVDDVPASWRAAKRQGVVEARTDATFSELGARCRQGDVRAQWRATHVPDGKSYHYESSVTFEAIPPPLWNDGVTGARINFIWRAAPDKVTLIVGGAFVLFSMLPVEVQFRRNDIERVLRPLTKLPRPGRAWDHARDLAFAWLTENGNPRPGDGEQAKLEKHIADKLTDRDGCHPSESTIRRHVVRYIEDFRHTL